MIIVTSALAFVVSFFVIVGVRPALARLGVVDVPNERSSHTAETLRGAGVGPLAGLAVALLILLALTPDAIARLGVSTVLAVALLAGVLGLVEDVRGVPIAARAACELLIGIAATGLLVGGIGAPAWWVPVGGLIIAGYVNVANFMDGINGISGLHAIAVGLTYAVIAAIFGLDWIAPVGVAVAAAFAGFLPLNLVRGRVFLGDTGSYLLGGVLAAIALCALLLGVPPLAALGPAAIYLADTAFTFAKRVLQGARWYEAHRSHVYQQLVGGGLSHLATAGIVTAFTGITTGWGLLSVFGWSGDIAAGLGIAATIVAYLLLPRLVVGRNTAEANQAERADEVTVPNASARLDFDQPLGGPQWAVMGASGFVGASICDFLRSAGIQPIKLAAPRVRIAVGTDPAEVVATARRLTADNLEFIETFRGCTVVVNAAGLAAPDSAASPELYGANALLPVLLAEAASRAGVPRLIHLSSAAVQGGRETLDESPEVEPFSAYSASKALGELAIAEWRDTAGSGSEVVVVRAASVQGHGRKTTESLRRLARLPIASVASPGTQHTPVTSVESLAAFVGAVGVHDRSVPHIVLQPWEGMTTRSVLEAAGHRAPIVLPASLCHVAVATGYALSRVLGGRLAGAVRRVELMWFGQQQRAEWAASAHVELPRLVATVLARPNATSSGEDDS